MHHVFWCCPTARAHDITRVPAQFIFLALPRPASTHCTCQHDLRQAMTVHWDRCQLLQQDL
eukprot:2989508-Pyramimonas_sp.AAC.1